MDPTISHSLCGGRARSNFGRRRQKKLGSVARGETLTALPRNAGLDVEGRDIGSYVAEAQRVVATQVKLPPGYTMTWSGQYEYMERAKKKMMLVVPATLAIIVLLLYFNFRSGPETAMAIGFIALAGVAAETGVIMLIYLDHAWDAAVAAAGEQKRRPSLGDLYGAVMEGAVERVRPKMMTVTAIMGGLLPILWGSGTGASVMKRIAAPMIGGMVSSTVLTLVVIPAVYSLWRERGLRAPAPHPSKVAQLIVR